MAGMDQVRVEPKPPSSLPHVCVSSPSWWPAFAGDPSLDRAGRGNSRQGGFGGEPHMHFWARAFCTVQKDLKLSIDGSAEHQAPLATKTVEHANGLMPFPFKFSTATALARLATACSL